MDYSEDLLERAIASLQQSEIQALIVEAGRVLKQASKPAAPGVAEPSVRLDGEGAAFGMLGLYVRRLERELAAARSAAHRAPQVRALLHLREKLQAQHAARRPGDEAANAPAVAEFEPVPHNIYAAISQLYVLTVKRVPLPSEIAMWKGHLDAGLPFHELVMILNDSAEARRKVMLDDPVHSHVSDGEFVQLAYELVLGRGAASWEICGWLVNLENGRKSRAQVLSDLFESGVQRQDTIGHVHDGLSCSIMGTDRFLSAQQWHAQAEAMQQAPVPAPPQRYANRLQVRGEPRVLVSAIASLYRGGEFIEQFMDNITSQDGFDEYCELIIVDADSPEDEAATIQRYLSRHSNINYIRTNYRIGIYDAWNVGAQAARGSYLTNTNLDDIRRHDSLMLQAGLLEAMPFVDVVYQDLYYTFDPRLPFEQIAAFGHATQLPIATGYNMMKFNSPHNAPMWRKRLHDELGYFDIRYKSAGDYEFWMRCMAAGKKFYKLNDPHVVYYQNPKGLSTRPDTRGVVEGMDVTRAYGRKLVGDTVLLPHDAYVRRLGLPPSGHSEDPLRTRYDLAQQALRNLARTRKYAGGSVA